MNEHKMKKNSDLKRDMIISAAAQRFSHFGEKKTTMSEIAKDLSISKALLYYYFPDKKSLFFAVVDDIKLNYVQLIDDLSSVSGTLSDKLKLWLNKRNEYMLRHYTFIQSSFNFSLAFRDAVHSVLIESLKKDSSFLSEMFSSANESGEIFTDNVEKVITIFQHAVHGLGFSFLSHHKNPVFPSREEIKSILGLQLKFISIFINGLKK